MRSAAAFNAAPVVSIALASRLGLALPPVWRDCAFVPSLGASRWLALGDNPNGANEAGDRAKKSQQNVEPKLTSSTRLQKDVQRRRQNSKGYSQKIHTSTLSAVQPLPGVNDEDGPLFTCPADNVGLARRQSARLTPLRVRCSRPKMRTVNFFYHPTQQLNS